MKISATCQALDDNSKRCRRAASVTRDIHGDHELRDVQWHYLRVSLCAVHDLKPKKRKP